VAATDFIGLIESVYQAEIPQSDWLAAIAGGAHQLLDRGLGVAAYTYDLGGNGEPSITEVRFAGEFDPSWIVAFHHRMGRDAEVVDRPPIEWRTWFHIPCGTASQVRGLERLTAALPAFGGARDILSINGRDPRGFGVWLGVPLPRTMRLGEKRHQLLTRLAAHFAAAHRLRRALAGQPLSTSRAEAVLSPSGKTLHAEGEARLGPAREELRRAVLRIDRARSRDGRRDSDRATGLWRGMVDSRWSLVDSFENDGKHYVLAARNHVEIAPSPSLTEREQQVMAFAAMGHRNKEIAYELGLSASTVRVLMARAAKKLGARGRADAIERFRERA
jgi:DNA-binding CsgD family transcriptional regulator